MKRYPLIDDAVLSEINITPFTDVLLVLLIIFMIFAALEPLRRQRCAPYAATATRPSTSSQ